MDFFRGFGKKRSKPITKQTARELRVSEIRAEGKRKQLEAKAMSLAKRKQVVFEQGAKAGGVLRRTIAQQFDALTTEEVLVGKRLSIATQEVTVVAQIRAVKEQEGDGAVIRAADFPALAKVMDKAAAQMEHQDNLLGEGLEGMRVEMSDNLGEAGADVLRAWEQMDSGVMEPDEALVEADRATRERMSAAME